MFPYIPAKHVNISSSAEKQNITADNTLETASTTHNSNIRAQASKSALRKAKSNVITQEKQRNSQQQQCYAYK